MALTVWRRPRGIFAADTGTVRSCVSSGSAQSWTTLDKSLSCTGLEFLSDKERALEQITTTTTTTTAFCYVYARRFPWFGSYISIICVSAPPTHTHLDESFFPSMNSYMEPQV